jgi:hypothetical protein
MAFCNSCGATLAPGTKFCSKCGATVAGGPSTAAAAPTTATPAAPPKGGSSALKIILIVVVVIVGIGILGIATVGFIGYRIAKSAHVRGGNVKVETPFGAVESSTDPDKAAKDLGIDIYPGAQVQKNGASSATFGGVHTVAAKFETSDSLDKVCDFYKSRFPNAMVANAQSDQCNFVSSDKNNMITINIQASGGTTDIKIANVKRGAPEPN